jgi:hypothetical protein
MADARTAIEERIAELRDELKKHEDALAALTGEVVERVSRAARRATGGGQTTQASGKRSSGKLRAKRASGATSRRGRPPSGNRERFLKLVGDRPGITTAEARTELGVTNQAVYGWVKALPSGTVTKRGTGYHPGPKFSQAIDGAASTNGSESRTRSRNTRSSGGTTRKRSAASGSTSKRSAGSTRKRSSGSRASGSGSSRRRGNAGGSSGSSSS